MGLLCVRAVTIRLQKLLIVPCSQQPTVKRVPPKNYAENFLYRPGKLRIMRTK